MLPAIAAIGAILLTVDRGLMVPTTPSKRPTSTESRSSVPISETKSPEAGSPLPDNRDEAPPRTGMVDLPLRDPVRGSSGAKAHLSLAEVKSLHVPAFGSDASLRALHKALVDRLGRGTRFRITVGPEEADAMLRLTEPEETLSPGIASDHERPPHALLVLINRGGDVIWQESPYSPGEGVEARARRVAESLIAGARQSP